MPPSVDSSRPIMAPSVSSARASKRFSTISTTPSLAPSTDTTASDPRIQDIKTLTQGLERLNSARLQQQRYSPSKEKTDSMAKLSLSAKVERALARRMIGQDAVLRVKAKATVTITEKQL